MRPPKLTDEELSRVLGQQAVGMLWHGLWGQGELAGGGAGCGCVAGAAAALGGGNCVWLPATTSDYRRLMAISEAVVPTGETYDYPQTPEALLAYLHDRGVA